MIKIPLSTRSVMKYGTNQFDWPGGLDQSQLTGAVSEFKSVDLSEYYISLHTR